MVQCTIRQKQSKTVKRQVKTAKNHHWCTNRHMSTKTVPTVYQSSKTVKRQTNSKKLPLVYQSPIVSVSTQSPPNTQSRANAATLRNLHHNMCLSSGHSPSLVGRADCMCLHGRPCVWLPFAAACCYTLFYLLMMPAARRVCQRPSSNFPYFRTPLVNSLLSRPNSVEYGNSKTTTTLLPSAKCTRPLFQGRTGCGRRPSGWHDIVTMPASSFIEEFPGSTQQQRHLRS